MLEAITHALGLCGDSHPTFLVFLLDLPQINHILYYIKTWRI